MDAVILQGNNCSCALADDAVILEGSYYRYELHKRKKMSGIVTIDVRGVLRVGITRTYSRFLLLIPMCLGFITLTLKQVSSSDSNIWLYCAVLCLVTILPYRLSYRNDLEINAMQGRYLLPYQGMSPQDVLSFQRAVEEAKKYF